MIWLLILIPILYLLAGGYIYWNSTWEEESVAVALFAVFLWPVLVIYMLVSIHSGKATVKRRNGERWRRVDGKWKRIS